MRVGVESTSRTCAYLTRGSTRNMGEFPGKILTGIARSISSTRVYEGNKGMFHALDAQAVLRGTQLESL
jgi:hypothetical protein